MQTTIRSLSDGDVLIEVDGDWAYLGIVDCNAYESFIGEWAYDNLTLSIVRQMNMERVFAWGCPEGRWSIQLSKRTLPQCPVGFHELTAYIVTTGKLSLTNYDGFAMCAQFANYHLPLEDDFAFEVEPGRYRVTLRQLFRWNGKAQCPGDEFPDEAAEGLNYLVSIVPDSQGSSTKELTWVPLAFRHSSA